MNRHITDWDHSRYLLPYVTAELPDEEREQVASHIARCDTCREEVRAFESMLAVVDRERIPDGRTAGAEAPAPPGGSRADGAVRREAPGPQPATVPRHRIRSMGTLAVAGLVLIAAVAYQSGGMNRGGAGSSPLRPVTAATLLPPRRGEPEVPRLRGRGPFALTLVLPFDSQPGTYRARVERRGSREVVHPDAPTSSPVQDRLTLLVPPLEEADVYVVVLEREGSRPHGSIVYPFEVADD